MKKLLALLLVLSALSGATSALAASSFSPVHGTPVPIEVPQKETVFRSTFTVSSQAGADEDTVVPSATQEEAVESTVLPEAEPTAPVEIAVLPEAEPTAPVESSAGSDESLWLSPDQFYYQQLSPEHKAAWETDIANALSYPDQTPATQQDRRLQALASMIKADNPQIFWIDWIDSVGRLRFETGSVATYAALQMPDARTLEEHKALYQQAVSDAVAEIQAGLSDGATVRDKALAIHDWLCENNEYNYSQTTNHKSEHDPVAFAYQAAHSSYSAIIPGDAYEPVCDGYASAFKVLCDAMDVSCICIIGSANFASGHMWNYVQTEDGGWYLVDVTSDDTATGSAAYHHAYFMIGEAESAKQGFAPKPYLNSGVNPANGYTEGAAFTVPTLVP